CTSRAPCGWSPGVGASPISWCTARRLTSEANGRSSIARSAWQQQRRCDRRRTPRRVWAPHDRAFGASAPDGGLRRDRAPETAAAATRKLGVPSSPVTRELLAVGRVPVTAFRRVATAIGRKGAPRVDVCHEFDTRFDAFWEHLRSREGLVCVRDAEALRWRFG